MERFAGRYTLLRLLGQGGMGTVHLALDLSTGAECALKRLRAGAPRVAPDSLRHEFELLTRVRHPAVVGVYELGFAPDGTPYYTMEYVPGVSADQGLAHGNWRTLCFAVVEVARGLEALHAVGIVHGDLKPSNVLVIPAGEGGGLPRGVRVVDFGLAGLIDQQREGHRGTPGFAAPEVVRGAPLDVAADLYGLGATMYALASGRSAFAPTTSESRLRRQQTAPPSVLPLEEASVPAPLIQLILRLMAPDPIERPRNAREVRAELERIEPAVRRNLSERLQSETVLGRERELVRIERWMLRGSHAPTSMVVSGAPGIGKTALLTALATRATLAGRPVVRLSCAAFDAPGSLLAALGQRLAAEAQTDSVGFDPAEPLRLTAGSSHAGAFELDVTRWAEAAVRWGQALASRSPGVTVVLDDAEHLDAASLAVLRRVALHPDAGMFRWVWSGRASAYDLEGADRALREAGQVERLVLGPLDREAVGRLVAAKLQEVPPRELVEYVWKHSTGHPGLAVEMLRAAADGSALFETEFGLTIDPAALAVIDLPRDFESSLRQRLTACSLAAKTVAHALAIVDGARLASELVRLDGTISPAAIDELLAAGLAVRADDGRLRLSPPGLAITVLASLSVEERRELHRSALDHPAISNAERFRHLQGAGDPAGALAAAGSSLAEAPDLALTLEAASLAREALPAETAEWEERAARALVAHGRHRSAIEHARRSLELEPRGAQRSQRWLLLSAACLRAGTLLDLEQVISSALRENPPHAVRSLLRTNDAARLSALGRLADAGRVAGEALVDAEASGDDEALGLAALTLGGILVQGGAREEVEALARRAEEAFARTGNFGGCARTIGLRANAAYFAHDVSTAEQEFNRALDVARSRGLRLPIEDLLMNFASMLVESGRWTEAAAAFEEVTRIALEDGRPRAAALAMANLALLDAFTGRPTRAARRARVAGRIARAHSVRFECFAWRALATARRISGRPRAADRAIRRALAISGGFGPPGEQDWGRVEYAMQCVVAGRWKEAGEVADRTLKDVASERAIGTIVLKALSGRAALRRRDPELVALRLAACDQALAGQEAPYALAHVLQLRAEHALVHAQFPEAVARAQEALATFAALPAPADRALAALEFARLAMAGGGGSAVPVSGWLHEAAGAFERLGDHPNRERALAFTVEWLDRTRGPALGASRDRDLLESVSRLVDSLSDPDELSRRAMQMVVEHLDAERGVLLFLEPKTGKLAPVVEHGALDAAASDKALSYSRRVVERVADSGGSLLIGDAPSDPDVRSESVVDLGLRSIVCVPMYAAGKVLGAVYLDDSRRPDAFSVEDRGLLEGFAHLMAVSLEKSRGHEEVRRANEQLVGENLSLRQEASVRFQPQNFVGASSTMQKVLAMVERAAQTATTVLITGENGTGKELIARILHHSGRRRLAPFVAVNCGAIPETLLESELFGILPNVATGVRGRDGRFVQANGGTLFLDEIADMPLAQQVALLSVLANREITPVGGGRAIPVDVRVIAATNRDLSRRVAEGTFREDLFYRLNVIPIEMPPLRERKADIPAMAHFFAAHFARQQERAVPELSPEFLAALMQSDWPGNVRELQNYIERIMAMTAGPVLYPRPLPRDLESRPPRLRIDRGKPLAEVIGDVEKRLIREALERCDGNQSWAARELGLTEQTLRYRLRKYEPVTPRRNRRLRRKRR